ncbi:MAG TPA: TRAP transporter large permease subunit [Burkholderiaceae bacterium]|nr:TRAP transporter large permease subunit [Burkholderiaceae bacterium]
MTAWLAAHLAPLMFAALALALFSGVPVVFALAGCGLGFAWLGVHLDVMPPALITALPLRVFGIMASELLLAIPFFTFMGLMLDRSGLAEEVLDTARRLSGGLRGGLALSVVAVGALLAATTGVVAASVISIGTVTLPLMLRQGYDPRIAAGVVAAAGALTQIVPPSLSLIVLADQLGRGVGEMYAAALMPAAVIIAAYALLVALLAWWRPHWLPAVPRAPSVASDAGGAPWLPALAVLAFAAAAGAVVAAQLYPGWTLAWGRGVEPSSDERVVVAIAVAAVIVIAAAAADRRFDIGWLSPLARRAVFACAPPLLLIFLVLGTIYVGLATPTESGAMGAAGSALLAWSKRRLTRVMLASAALRTAKLSCFVIFILIGSTMFSHTFAAIDGNLWVEGLFAHLPGGAVGFLVVVTALTFVLGMFLDYLEIAFILIPLLAPLANKLGIDLVWFGVLIGINLQTSFLTPPFGYALFFLRSVAPHEARVDATSGQRVPGVSTRDIYVGVMPFVAVQVLVMAAVIAWPSLIRLDGRRVPQFDDETAERVLEHAADAGALFTPGRPRPDPVVLLMQHLREVGLAPAEPPR